MAPRFDAVVASVFVRAASGSGRMDLAAPTCRRCCRTLARADGSGEDAVRHAFFGNPYTATFLPELPAVLLTYDFYDRAGSVGGPGAGGRGARSAAGCRSRCRGCSSAGSA